MEREKKKGGRGRGAKGEVCVTFVRFFLGGRMSSHCVSVFARLKHNLSQFFVIFELYYEKN